MVHVEMCREQGVVDVDGRREGGGEGETEFCCAAAGAAAGPQHKRDDGMRTLLAVSKQAHVRCDQHVILLRMSMGR